VISRSLAAIQPPEVRAKLDPLAQARRAACPPSEHEVLDAADARRAAARQRGRTAVRTGAAAEALAHRELDDAVASGRLAWWRAVGAPTKHTRTGLVYAGKGPCDIVAMTTRGRCLVAEIKSGTQLWQSPRAKRGSGPALAEHQAEQLDATARSGGIALVCFHSRGALHWLSWPLPWRDGRVIAPADAAPSTLNDTLEMIGS
jgi:hypothetical protein